MNEPTRSRRRRRKTAVSPYDQRANRFSLSSWLLLGLILGLGGALYYGWVVSPVVYTDATPARLSATYKSDYIALIGLSYRATGNWAVAEARLGTLEDETIAETVAFELEEAIRQQKSDRTIRGLAALAQTLGVTNQTVALFAPTPATAVPTATATPEISIPPTATATLASPTETAVVPNTPTPTAPPTTTAQPNFRLLNQQQLCDQETPQIVVIVLDALLNQQPGTEVNVIWADGRDRFFTGFKPEEGLGYGDFTMSPDISYTVVLPEGSPEISGLRIETCEDGSLAGWELTFQNLRLTLDE